jgi:hypothetical protein
LRPLQVEAAAKAVKEMAELGINDKPVKKQPVVEAAAAAPAPAAQAGKADKKGSK